MQLIALLHSVNAWLTSACKDVMVEKRQHHTYFARPMYQTMIASMLSPEAVIHDRVNIGCSW